MKLRGGDWSKGDVIALLALLVAVVGVIAAILAVPGMPKIFPWDSADKKKESAGPSPAQSAVTPPAPRSVQQAADVNSAQVNFGCEQTVSVETPIIRFGRNPRDVKPQPSWQNTDHVKSQNQSVQNLEDPTDHHLVGVKAVGTITGVDKQLFNCPGGGHGELKLHVTWTEDQ